ncbi:MAG: ATP-binding cassette domain-containing protein, partial [Alphaproteobacteria bacterium]|nr:ATP-binding cassette domain-containing protein [Alphaproteobacteria bacterium]
LARRDILRAAASSLGLAGLRLLPPMAAFGLYGAAGVAGLDGRMLSAFAALSVGAIAFEAARAIAILRATGRVDTTIMAALLQRLPRAEIAPLRRLAPGPIQRGLLGFSHLRQQWRGGPPIRLLDGLGAIGAIALAAAMDPVMAAFMAALMVPAFAVPVLSAWAAAHAVRASADGTAATRRLLFDALRTIGRLRLMDADGRVLDQWQSRHDGETARRDRIRRWDNGAMAFTRAWPYLSAVGLAAMVPSPWLLPPFLALGGLGIAAALDAGRACASVVGAAPTIRDMAVFGALPLEPEGGPVPARAEALRLRSVGYRYEGTRRGVLDDVNLAVEPGSVTAIAGPSGSGKSTLLRLILGYDHPGTGVVAVDGIDLRVIDRAAWRRSVGAVMQGDRIAVAGTLRSHVAGLSPHGTDAVWWAVEAAQVADDIRRMPMGMQTIIEEHRISTGQKQRLLIARQLIRRPRLLVLDEATSAIPDPIQAALFANLRALGITTLVASHRVTTLALADHLLVLDHGRVAYGGPPAPFLDGHPRLEEFRP